MAHAWTLEPATVAQIEAPIEDAMAGSFLFEVLRAHTVRGQGAKTIDEALRPVADLEMAALPVGADVWVGYMCRLAACCSLGTPWRARGSPAVFARHSGERSYWQLEARRRDCTSRTVAAIFENYSTAIRGYSLAAPARETRARQSYSDNRRTRGPTTTHLRRPDTHDQRCGIFQVSA